MRHPSAGLMVCVAVLAGAIVAVAFPVLAQDGTSPMPQNAQARSYGGGWVCERGFVKLGDRSDATILPANTFPDPASNGPGRSCDRGFRLSDGMCILGR